MIQMIVKNLFQRVSRYNVYVPFIHHSCRGCGGNPRGTRIRTHGFGNPRVQTRGWEHPANTRARITDRVQVGSCQPLDHDVPD